MCSDVAKRWTDQQQKRRISRATVGLLDTYDCALLFSTSIARLYSKQLDITDWEIYSHPTRR